MRPKIINLIRVYDVKNKLLFVIIKILHGEFIMFVFQLNSLFSRCEVMAFQENFKFLLK
jgi:hypothetical protein